MGGARTGAPEEHTRRRGRKPAAIALSEDDGRLLARWAAGLDAPSELARRARVVLACAGGASNQEVATALGMSAHGVGRWRTRFARDGVAALVTEARPGAPVQIELDGAQGPSFPSSGAVMSKSTAGRLARASALLPHAEDGALPRGAALLGVHVFVGDHAFALVGGRPRPREWSGEREAEPTLAVIDHRARLHLATTLRRHSALRLKRFFKDVAAVSAGETIHLVVDQPPTGIVRNWLARRSSFVVHVAGTRHAWWSLLTRWCEAESPGWAEAVDRFLESPEHEATPFVWIAPPSPADRRGPPDRG